MLLGGLNNDLLVGGIGDDRLEGGADNDRLTGSDGADVFVFANGFATAGLDTITDFDDLDIIELSSSVFSALGTGVLDAAAFALGGLATDAGDRILYDATTGGLFYDADGSNVGAAVQFAQLGTGLNLQASDFMVV
ncbi:calcium-binding protein [Methylobrevis pamukkalensis]|uniref:calcium-binding protein n=1 Tax=Methylobrevis pamukkalensis TaxID=1439726 RepID=UPI0008460CA9|nr:calcium-binding protein [Methylobrevis pamukkalensis]